MTLPITQSVQEAVYPASVAPCGTDYQQAPIALPASLLFACVLLISGCSQEKSGEYQQYSDLPQSSSIPSSAAPADSIESPAPSDPDGVTPAANPSPASGGSPTTTASESPGQQNTSAASESAAVTSDSGSQESSSGNAETTAIPTEQPPTTQTSDTPPASENTALTADLSSKNLSDEAARSTDAAPSSDSETNTEPGATPAAAETKSEPPSGDVPPETPKEPLTIQLLIPEKTFRLEKNSNAVRVTYDDIDLLKILNMEPVPVDAVSHFPAWLKEMDGTRIRIRGFMMPTFEATGLKAFTMARDNGICCFVRQPKIYDIIEVVMADGFSSDYIDGKPFDVEGVFRIQPEADETEIYRLYRIENARVLR
jgi:hypothetical protein